MHIRRLILLGVVALIMASWLSARAVTRYVSLAGADDAAGGYTNWAGAATAIQAAVDTSGDGDVILVSNGVYMAVSGSQVVNITNSLDIRGVYGREATFINGENVRRGVSMAQTASTGAPIYFSGFTITNGTTDTSLGGGGIMVSSVRDVYIADCVISNNSATATGGGGVM